MKRINSTFRVVAMSLLMTTLVAASAFAETDEFLLVTRSWRVEPIQLRGINDRELVHFDHSRAFVRVPINECIALLNPNTGTLKPKQRTLGMLILADGQRLPGRPMNATNEGSAFSWTHPWLGRLDVPLQRIESILLSPDAAAPKPGQGDVVSLTNGDQQEGFIIAIDESIAMEVRRDGTSSIVSIPLNRVKAVTMVATDQKSTGRRIWFDEGTVLDAESVNITEEGFVQLSGSTLVEGTQGTRVELRQITAVLFSPGEFIPLASLSPISLEGPETRYELPEPIVKNPDAPLGLSDIEYRGPLVVRYALPVGCQRFLAHAELPKDARTWGDYELILKTDDDELFRTRINSDSPTASINVQLTGREFTIEITQGARGPIQDRLLLSRAMLLTGR